MPRAWDVYPAYAYGLLGASVGIPSLRPVQCKYLPMSQVTNPIDPERGNGPGIFTVSVLPSPNSLSV